VSGSWDHLAGAKPDIEPYPSIIDRRRRREYPHSYAWTVRITAGARPVLFSRRASDFHAPQARNSPAFGGRPRDALDHGNHLLCSAYQRRRARDLPPKVLLGRNRQCEHSSTIHAAIPASRDTVPTGYGSVLPDQNGWSRYLHFQAAWAAVLTGLVYVTGSLWTGHFRDDLFPAPRDRTWKALWGVIARYLRRAPPSDAHSYNVLQRTAYMAVIFLLFPLVVWTGLALSPSFDAAVPMAVNALGGRQSARTLHFFVSGFLLLFLVVHVTMVVLAGFRSRMRAMITGRAVASQERT